MKKPSSDDNLGESNHEEEIPENTKLARLGFKPLLSRSLDGIMSFALGFSRINTVIGIAPLLGYGLRTGGQFSKMCVLTISIQ
jgi:hypothetical protein